MTKTCSDCYAMNADADVHLCPHHAKVDELIVLLRNAGRPRIPKGEDSKRSPCWCNTSLYCQDEPGCIATRALLNSIEVKHG